MGGRPFKYVSLLRKSSFSVPNTQNIPGLQCTMIGSLIQPVPGQEPHILSSMRGGFKSIGFAALSP